MRNLVRRLTRRLRKVPTQNGFLPVEILLEIFHLAQAIPVDEPVGDTTWYIAFDSHEDATVPAEVRDTQKELNHLLLVCRWWYEVGLDLLYRKPRIMSPAQLRVFTRALSRNPVLAGAVHSLVLLDNNNYSSKFSKLQTRHYGTQARRCSEDLIHLFSLCPSMHHIQIRLAPLFDESLFAFTVFTQNQDNRLRSISLHSAGIVESFMHCRSDFPSLEELCLERHDQRHFVSSKFPALRVLRLRQTKLNGRDCRVPEGLSHLHTLELISIERDDDDFAIGQVLYSSYSNTLHSLRIGGWWHTRIGWPPLPNIDYSLLVALKNLVLVHPVGEREPREPLIPLPDCIARMGSLEHLVLVFNFSLPRRLQGLIRGWWPPAEGLQEIKDMVAVLGRPNTLPALKHLEVAGVSGANERGSLSSADLRALESLCSSRGIALNLHIIERDETLYHVN